jgi:Sortase domain
VNRAQALATASVLVVLTAAVAAGALTMSREGRTGRQAVSSRPAPAVPAPSTPAGHARALAGPKQAQGEGGSTLPRPRRQSRPGRDQGGAHGPGPGRPVGARKVKAATAPAPAATGSALVIPSLGIDAPLVPAGASGQPQNASFDVPSDIHTVGWWDGSVRDGQRTVHEDAPAPGQPGVALIAGHIDSAQDGPGALYDLGHIAVGAIIVVRGSQGHTSRWTVSSPPQTALKTGLPSSLWVTSGAPKLALVTCGGPFDYTTGHYLDNVIVWATPAGRGNR